MSSELAAGWKARGATKPLPANPPAGPEAAPAGARRTLSLRAHLVLLTLLATLPVLAMGTAAAWHVAGNYREAFEDRLRDSARGLALAIEAEIGIRLTTLAALAASPLLDGSAPDLPAFQLHARRTAEAMGSPVILLRDDLTPVPGTEGQALHPGALDAARSALDTGRPVVSNLLGEGAPERHHVAVAVPVPREAGSRMAVVARIDPGVLAAPLAAGATTPGSLAALTDARRRIVARSRDQQRFVGSAIAPEAAAGIGLARSLDGEDMFYALQQIRGLPGWRVAAAQPAAAHRASWQRPLLALGLGGALAMLAAALGAAAFGRRIILPVDALTRKARNVARNGDTLMGVPPSGVTEFEALRGGIAEAEIALRTGEARFLRAAKAARLSAWDWDPAADLLRGSPLLEEDAEGGPGAPARSLAAFLDLVHPEDRPLMREALRRIQDGETDELQEEFRLLRADGSVRWLHSIGRAILRPDGSLREVAGISMDVTERVEGGRSRDALAREVDHRAKNALAVVQSILRLTPVGEPRAFAAAIEGRVGALVRAHSLLAEQGWFGADLRSLAERELAPYLPPDGAARVVLDGPLLSLAASAVQPLTMVLHELVTNAARHGALSGAAGRVELSWQVGRRAGEDEMVRLRWSESDGSPTEEAPGHRGFGSRVIDSTVRGQLGGTVRRCWSAPGLVCEIVVPAARLLAGGRPAPERSAA